MELVIGQMVGHSGLHRVQFGTTELLISDYFTCGCLDEGRPTQEDCASVLDNDDLVRHGGHIGATSSARATYDSDLRNAGGRHPRLVVENLSEVIFVWEYVVLLREEGASGVNEVDARQLVLHGDLLGADVFLDCDRVVCAALVSEIIGDDHARLSMHLANASDYIS